MATSARPEGEDKPTSLESTLDVIGKATIGTDGRLTVEIPVQTPRLVSLYVLNAVDADGEPVAPAKGNKFILEPGQLRLTMSRRDRFIIKGAGTTMPYTTFGASRNHIAQRRPSTSG